MNLLRNKLLGALVGLARASECKEISESAGSAYIDGLALAFSSCPEEFTSLTSASGGSTYTQPDEETILAMIDRLHEEKALMAPDCAACQYPCGRTFDYDMEEVYGASETLRDAKMNLFAALAAIAVTAPANASKENRQFISDALFQISCTYEASQLSEPLKTAEVILQSNT